MFLFLIVILLACYIIGSAEVRQHSDPTTSSRTQVRSVFQLCHSQTVGFCSQACPLGASVAAATTHHLLTQLLHKQKGCYLIREAICFIREKRHFRSPSAQDNLPSCLVGQICVTCPLQNGSLAKGMNYQAWTRLIKTHLSGTRRKLFP